MSRGKPEQTEFGSDSFLDITANIVGILIILIVIAGLRVSQAPVFITEKESDSQALDIVKAEPLQILEEEPETVEDVPLVQEIPEEEPEEEKPILPDPELQNEILRKKAEIANLQKEIENQNRELQTVSQNSRQLKLHLANASSTRKLAIESASQSRREFRQKKQELDKTNMLVNQLTEKLSEFEKTQAPTKKIKHHFSPVSKEVKGEEIHYRLANNRISHIPLDKLLEDLKKEIYRQRDWLIKFNQHQGQVGPIRGFSMSYTVGRERPSVLDELRTGRGMIRIGVKEWTLQIDPDVVVTEDVETALKPGSRFLNSLATAGADTTLTFWVYPDSYSIYRQIQSYAHDQHFQVAARPLPFGIPIAGSPSGSRSSGQ